MTTTIRIIVPPPAPGTLVARKPRVQPIRSTTIPPATDAGKCMIDSACDITPVADVLQFE